MCGMELERWKNNILGGNGPLRLVPEGAASLPVRRATTFVTRFLGLMGRKAGRYGLLLAPCDSIHMLFMRFALDAVFVDRAGMVVSIRRNVKPWGFAFGGKGAHAVLELPASLGLADHIRVGEPLPLEPGNA